MESEIRIYNRIIGEGRPVFIIAEAGVNHNGDIELAKKLIEVAKDAGADAVKFQTFKTEEIIIPDAPKSTYHFETTGLTGTWFDLLKTQELDREAHKILIGHCKKIGIMFLSTPYDEESADMLEELGLPAFKIASTDANNIPFLQYLASRKIPLILSTAMCSLEEVRESVDAIRSSGCDDLILLHCTANYPSALEDSNLQAMLTMKKDLNVMVGYSDHNPGYINPIAAVALGAVVYERHLTLDKGLYGPDHRSSLEPYELKNMVNDIRRTEAALGSPEKRPLDSEKENRVKLRKSVVARIDISPNTILTRDMLATKRPGTGLAPVFLDSLIGEKAVTFLQKDSLVKMENLK